MKPTTDIVEELRLYNRWRRGDEAITAPDPTALGKLLDDAADRIEHLFASGIHTCHADCQRPMCVLRRERDKALADLARVTAERQNWKEWAEEARAMFHKQIDAAAVMKTRAEQAEQRNAELVAALREYKRLKGCHGEYRAWSDSAEALARAESATPAKHPDTERLDWLEGAPSERLAEVRRILWQQRNTCEATRAAIDVARKQEASK